jgi:preprotein translocase subunit SecA
MMLKRFISLFGGDPNKHEINQYSSYIQAINSLELEYEKYSDEALLNKTSEFRQRLQNGETLDDILSEAFALVREASKRTIGLRHYDVQLIGGIVLHRGKIAEMRTGEGKTLVATLPMYLNALTGNGVHLITVNDYLARRDARWMAPIFYLLGLNVGVLQIAARTENGKKAFLVDPGRTSPLEDQDQLQMVNRRDAYAADIVYGTNSEFGFDYLRDNMTRQLDERVQRGHHYAIVDEVDNVLIDEARTPLIISGPAEDESPWYIKMAQIVRQLREEDVDADDKNRVVVLTEIGEIHVEELLGTPLRDPNRPEDLKPDQARTLGYLEQALRAQFLFRKNKDYLVQSGKVIIVDEFTGRLMPGRRWSEGLHQAIEAKEGVKVEAESVTYATVTIQNYFRMYQKLAGMTGTAVTESEEFNKIYKLDVTAIPTNLEYLALLSNSELVQVDGRDEDNYKFLYYTRRNDVEKKPVYWKRKDFPDTVFRTEEMKLRNIVQELLRFHILGRPVLVGTTSVELSERVSNRLRAEPIRRLCQILILRKVWMEQHDREMDGRQIPELQFLNGSLDKIDPAEMRKLGRELDISLNPEDPINLERLVEILRLENHDTSRLVDDLRGGTPHEVLNARKHTEESQIIAGAGAFGAITIATNMAGRGVDIKLGGEVAEEVIAAVNRVLKRAGYPEPYNMSFKERQVALLAIDPAEYGIYDSEVKYFMQHLEDMERVRVLGGLHVIGSERHEARRIDNQLRGRAARQGDPGSSRFYLSMEDPLMRMFGGGQADALMQRLKIDDAVPLEASMVGRIVESSQNRVEGANFDMRKHLLEYDDVLNNQRNRIYNQRDLIFKKTDLSEDVRDMLRTEISGRVSSALKNKEGPWELLAWLQDVQPPLVMGGKIIPSFTYKLIVNEIMDKQSVINGSTAFVLKTNARKALLEAMESSLNFEEEHLLNNLIELLEKTRERMEEQIKDRKENLDLFFEGLANQEEQENIRPQELVQNLQTAMRLPMRLTPEQMKDLRQNPKKLHKEVLLFMQNELSLFVIKQLISAIERRLDESLNLTLTNISVDDWNELENIFTQSIKTVFEYRHERYLGNGDDGLITHEIDNYLEKLPDSLSEQDLLKILIMLPQGNRVVFDKKTHKRMNLSTNRLTYFYYAAQLINKEEVVDISKQVLEHLESTLDSLKSAWGEYELTELYRSLILMTIDRLWVDYLTEMENLRISISLEAYAQRDPLVQYKNKAYSLFQELLSNVRLGVISKMFTFRPRNINVQLSPSQSLTSPSLNEGDERNSDPQQHPAESVNAEDNLIGIDNEAASDDGGSSTYGIKELEKTPAQASEVDRSGSQHSSSSGSRSQKRRKHKH